MTKKYCSGCVSLCPECAHLFDEKKIEDKCINYEEDMTAYGTTAQGKDQFKFYNGGEGPPIILGQHSPGAKLDDGKVDMSLIEFLPRAMKEVLRVMTYGKVKYTRGGFLEVPDGVNRYSAAMLRHYFAAKEEGKYDQDPWYDTEEGLPYKGKIMHDAQVAVNALFRLELMLREEEGNSV